MVEENNENVDNPEQLKRYEIMDKSINGVMTDYANGEISSDECRKKLDKIKGIAENQKDKFGLYFNGISSKIDTAYVNLGGTLEINDSTQSEQTPEASSNDNQPVPYLQQSEAADNVYLSTGQAGEPIPSDEAEIDNELKAVEASEAISNLTEDPVPTVYNSSEEDILEDILEDHNPIPYQADEPEDIPFEETIPEDIPFEETIPEDLEEDNNQIVYPALQDNNYIIQPRGKPKKVKKGFGSYFSKEKEEELTKELNSVSTESQLAEEKEDRQICDAIYNIVKNSPDGADVKMLRDGLVGSPYEDLSNYDIKGYVGILEGEKKLVRERKGISNIWLSTEETTLTPEELEKAFLEGVISVCEGNYQLQNEEYIKELGLKYQIDESKVETFINNLKSLEKKFAFETETGMTGEQIKEVYSNATLLVDDIPSADVFVEQAEKVREVYELKDGLSSTTKNLKKQILTLNEGLRVAEEELKSKKITEDQYQQTKSQLSEKEEQLKEARKQMQNLRKKADAQSKIVASDSSNLDAMPSVYFSTKSRQAYKKLLEVAPVMISSAFKTPWTEYHALEEMAANLLGVENGAVVEEPGVEELNILLNGLNGDDTMLGLKQIRMDPKFPSKKIGKTVDAFIAYAETLKELKENEQVIKNE